MCVCLWLQNLFYEKAPPKMNHKRIYVMIHNKHDLHTTRCEIKSQNRLGLESCFAFCVLFVANSKSISRLASKAKKVGKDKTN